jgi:hypothetical protein
MVAQVTASQESSHGLVEARQTLKRALRWWRSPFWLLAVLTGAKSFVDNPILGSRRLNRAGLHVWRLKAAHALARRRRARLAHLLAPDLKQRFDRDGFIVVRDVLPPGEFRRIQSAVLGADLECRSQQQGDTVTCRIPYGPAMRRQIPSLAALLDMDWWKGMMAYVASARSQPLYYVQAIAGGVAKGPPDPQLELHSDTFHPSLKAWLFLTDVPEDGRPLTYVAGSHRLSPERVAWERRRSIEIGRSDRLSQRGSLRIAADELPKLGLPPPTRFSVPANTLVVVDTCGFHARAASSRPTLRVELWAYRRRSPFVPWTGLDLLSWRPIAARRAVWLGAIVDWLDRLSLAKQHWRKAGRWRPQQLAGQTQVLAEHPKPQVAPRLASEKTLLPTRVAAGSRVH